MDAWIIKGEALHNLNRDTNAVKCYDKALELDPKNIGAWLYKWDSSQGLSKYEEAIACYDKVLEIDPIYANSWYAKGKAFEAIGVAIQSPRLLLPSTISCDRDLEVSLWYACILYGVR